MALTQFLPDASLPRPPPRLPALSRFQLIGIPATAEILERLIGDALAAGGLPRSTPLVSFGACMSGFVALGPRAEVEAALRARAPTLSSHYYIDNDTVGSIFTAVGGAPGVVLIAGTGSMGELSRGMDAPPGSGATVGGHGHFMGDEGSAWAIASNAIRTIFAQADAFHPQPAAL
jgi:N-acetylglucosamine kinase